MLLFLVVVTCNLIDSIVVVALGCLNLMDITVVVVIIKVESWNFVDSVVLFAVVYRLLYQIHGIVYAYRSSNLMDSVVVIVILRTLNLVDNVVIAVLKLVI